MARHARIKSPLIQVIFVSAEPIADTVLQAAQDGADDFLLKPVIAAELIYRLDEAQARFGPWQATIADTLCKTLPCGARQ